jgi:hypothetical protein
MSRLSRLPSFISHWLGHRSTPVHKHPDYVIYFWSFVGSFLGISLIQAVFGQAHYFIERGVPSIVASYVSLVCSLSSEHLSENFVSGSYGGPHLWCNRCPSVTTSVTFWRSFPRCSGWDLHHQIISPPPNRATVREFVVVSGLAFMFSVDRGYANNWNNASTRRQVIYAKRA